MQPPLLVTVTCISNVTHNQFTQYPVISSHSTSSILFSTTWLLITRYPLSHCGRRYSRHLRHVAVSISFCCLISFSNFSNNSRRCYCTDSCPANSSFVLLYRVQSIHPCKCCYSTAPFNFLWSLSADLVSLLLFFGSSDSWSRSPGPSWIGGHTPSLRRSWSLLLPPKNFSIHPFIFY